MPQGFWQKLGAAATAVVNAFVVVGQLVYKGLVALGTFLAQPGESRSEMGDKSRRARGAYPGMDRRMLASQPT